MDMVLFLVVLCAICLVLCLCFYIKGLALTKGIVYKLGHYKLAQKAFLFSKFVVYKNTYGIKFYAELDGKFWIVFGQKSRAEVIITTSGTMQPFNANAFCLSANSSQNINAYYKITKLHTSICNCNVIVKVENCNYLWLPNKQILRFKHNKSHFDMLFCGDVVTTSSNAHTFVLKSQGQSLIDYSSFKFGIATKEEAINFCRQYFGFYDTTTWQNKADYLKIYNKDDTPQKRYFLSQLNKEAKAYNCLFEIECEKYISLKPKSYCVLTGNRFIKIKLSDLGMGNVITLFKQNRLLHVKDLDINYSVFLRFSQKILKAFVGCVWGECYLFVQTENICVLEIKPFFNDFDLTLFINSGLQGLFCKKQQIQKLSPFMPNISLDGILITLNNQVISGQKINCCILDALYMPNLSHTTKFLLANLHLSFAVVNNAPISKSVQKMVLDSLKDIKHHTLSEVFCYVSKLKCLIKDEKLAQFLFEILTVYKPKTEFNFEYFWSYVLGIKICNGKLLVNSPQIEYSANLFVNSKKISIKTDKTSKIVINGIDYVGLDGVLLNNQFAKTVQLNCSID